MSNILNVYTFLCNTETASNGDIGVWKEVILPEDASVPNKCPMDHSHSIDESTIRIKEKIDLDSNKTKLVESNFDAPAVQFMQQDLNYSAFDNPMIQRYYENFDVEILAGELEEVKALGDHFSVFIELKETEDQAVARGGPGTEIDPEIEGVASQLIEEAPSGQNFIYVPASFRDLLKAKPNCRVAFSTDSYGDDDLYKIKEISDYESGIKVFFENDLQSTIAASSPVYLKFPLVFKKKLKSSGFKVEVGRIKAFLFPKQFRLSFVYYPQVAPLTGGS
jgi:hypothetical protein